MKKLFFFRSTSSKNGNNSISPPSTEKKVYWESPLGSGIKHQAGEKSENGFQSSRGLFSKSRKQMSDSQSCGTSSGLRRSRSLSSATFLVDELGQRNFSCSGDQSRSPSSTTNSALHQQYNHSSRRSRALTPGGQSREKRFEVASMPNTHGLERPCCFDSSRIHHDLSGSSSSSNASTKILDRYIDGEQHQERSAPTNSYSQRNYSGNGIRNGGGQLPPRVQHTVPTSPTGTVKGKPKSHSFREAKATPLHFSSGDWKESGFGHESPCSLAKNVVERLSQTYAPPRSSLKEVERDTPITIEDIYCGSTNRCSDLSLDVGAQRSYSLDDPYETVNEYKEEDFLSLQNHNSFFGYHGESLNSVTTEEDVDVELQKMSKEAEERVMILSGELERETFLCDTGFDVPFLVQTIRSLTEEKMTLLLEVSGLLQSRIAERASAKEELRLAKAEFESRTERLEREKIELQSVLEKELDKRSSDWSFKLEKYQMEEKRLRERVRELAEQNVSLLREVSSFKERETDSRSMINYSEQQLKDLSARVDDYCEENQELRKNISELREKFEATEADLNCIKRNFEEKEMECKDLRKSTTRLLRTCNEQEKTIAGLREGFSDEMGKKHALEKFDKDVAMLQMEQMRLTGVELSLRREVESYRVEVDSLRHENINLLKSLKGNGKESAALAIKLDKELSTYICCLQNQGLTMLNEGTRLCSQLLEFIKGKAGRFSDVKNGLDGQFIIESDMKVQGFKCRIESLTKSLQTMSGLLHEKSSLLASKSQSVNPHADLSEKRGDQTPEEIMRSELKAETLLTCLLREKLYSKELEVEQLQAELATAVRGNDILRCEVQSALDNLSCITHKLKDLELQMLKKDENISQLQRDLQDSAKELKIMKGILPKVSEERDMMWEEVKQYNEKNMLLNSEVNILKKKIETLDEDILLKEGQITILKDTIGRKPFDLLASPDSMREFLLE